MGVPTPQCLKTQPSMAQTITRETCMEAIDLVKWQNARYEAVSAVCDGCALEHAVHVLKNDKAVTARDRTLYGYFPQDWSSLHAGTPSGGRVGLRLELAWLGRAETPC